MTMRMLVALCITLLLGACTAFPRDGAYRGNDGVAAEALFARTLAAHGGDLRTHPGDINLATDGHWHALIQRIQPVVTDTGYRITSEERYRPSDGTYAVVHRGPAGAKHVLRTRDALSVHYDGRAANAEQRSATAMTNDAFRMFHFGPTYFAERARAWRRLPDAREGGRRYHRLHATLAPGFGDAAQDEAVLWIDAVTFRLWRIHQTLEGFATTRGAHVDTTFLEYRKVGRYLLPVRFSERVRGPLRIRAHDWWVTGIDMDRGWSTADVSDPRGFTGNAARPAGP